MKIIKNTLSALAGRWDDPGMYPNNVASSPLPSHNVTEEIGGKLVVELEDSDFDHMDVLSEESPDGTLITQWEIIKTEGKRITLSVKDFVEM